MTDTRPLAAAAAILTAMAIIGYIDNFVVVIAETGGLWQFHLLRALMVIPAVVLIAVALGWPVRPKSWGAVAGRSACWSAAMLLYFGSLAFLPIAQSVAGLFTSPIFVLILGAVFFGHKVGPVRIAAALVGFGGVLMVLQPWADDLSPWTLVAVAAGAFYALGAIATRQWCEGEGTMALLAGSFTAMALLGGLGVLAMTLFPQEVPAGPDGFVLRGWVAPDATFLFWTVVQAVGSLVAVGCITRAYQWGEASYVAVFEYSLLIFVSVWAFVLRGEGLDPLAAIGIGLIIGSGVVIALRSR